MDAIPFDLDSFPVNGTDLAIAAILVISGALAFFRGAVREVMAITGWIAAAAAAYYGFDYVRPYVHGFIGVPLLTDALTSIGIFVATMVVISLINGAISRRVKTSRLESLDRSLGFLFGLARGALVVCIAFLVMVMFVPPEEQPVSVQEARARPLVEMGAGWLVLAIPPEKRDEWAGALAEAKALANEALDNKSKLDVLMSPPPVAVNPGDPGYSDAERTDLDRLIETAQ